MSSNKKSRPVKPNGNRSQNRGNAGLNTMPAVVLHAMNGPAVHTLFATYLFTFPAGDHTIPVCPAYMTLGAKFTHPEISRFSAGKFPAPDSVMDPVALHVLPVLGIRSADPQYKQNNKCC